MKIVIKIFLLSFITLTSCNKRKSLSTENNILSSTSSYIDYDADSVYYKISVGYENDNYYQDKKANLLYLVTKEVYLDNNKNLGGFKHSNWYNEAKNHLKNKDKSVYLITKIGIRKIDKTFDYIWTYKSEININNNGYGVYELQISLEDSYAEYNNQLESRLHIHFKTVDYNEGYKLYTLNYTHKENQWKLVSREKICTIPKEINSEQIGYRIDTVNNNCRRNGNKFNLTNDYIFRLSNANCF